MDPQKVRLTAGEIPGRYRIAGAGIAREVQSAGAGRRDEGGGGRRRSAVHGAGVPSVDSAIISFVLSELGVI